MAGLVAAIDSPRVYRPHRSFFKDKCVMMQLDWQ